MMVFQRHCSELRFRDFELRCSECEFQTRCRGLQSRDRKGAERKSLVVRISRFVVIAVSLLYFLTAHLAFSSEPNLMESVGSSSKAPARIVTISPNTAEIICELGACSSIVGVDKFCVFPKELDPRPKVGGLFDPDLERIVSLKPDLVVVRGRCESLENLCREMSIAFYPDKTERLADIERTILELGQLLDRKSDAERVAERFRAKVEALRKLTPPSPRPRVLVTVSRRPDELSNILTSGKGTFLDELVSLAGGENVFGDVEAPWPQISPEAILTRRPDVILELMPEVKLTDDVRQQMLNQWRTLGLVEPVEKSRVFFHTEENVLIPSPRILAVVETMRGEMFPVGQSP